MNLDSPSSFYEAMREFIVRISPEAATRFKRYFVAFRVFWLSSTFPLSQHDKASQGALGGFGRPALGEGGIRP